MFNGTSDSRVSESGKLGPLVGDGAEYSAIGTVELKIVFVIDGDDIVDNIPFSPHGHTHWQYGQGEHASTTKNAWIFIFISSSR